MEDPKNYTEANALMQGRCKDRRKLANNTYLERRSNGTIAVRLHNTDIIVYFPDNTCSLHTGGWRTITTRDRLNRFSLCGVWQDQSVWYVGNWQDPIRVLFHEEIKIDPLGVPIDGKRERNSDCRAVKILKARIKIFAKFCADNCIGVRPGPGDCFYCQANISESSNGGNRESTLTYGTDNHHLDSHMTESYLVPSLIYAACKRFGASNATMAALYHGETWAEDHVKRSVNSLVCRYMYEQFGLAS